MGSLADKFSIYKRFRSFMKAEDKFYGKLLGSSIVGVLAIAMLAGILLFVAVRDHQFEDLRAKTLEVLRKIGDAENDITTLQAAFRGYLLTGSPAYANAFQQQTALAQTRLEDVASAVATNGAMSAQISDAKRHVTDWLQKTANPGVANRARGGTPNIEDLTKGRALLDSARQSLEAMESAEQTLISAHAPDQQSLGQSFQILLFAPKLENAISQMEAGEWGYLLTGDQASVDLYRQALTDFYAYHGHLTVLAQQSNLPRTVRWP